MNTPTSPTRSLIMYAERIGAGLLMVVALSISLAFATANDAFRFALHVFACIASHFFALFLLSLNTAYGDEVSDKLSKSSSTTPTNGSSGSGYTTATRCAGILAAIYTWLLQDVFPGSNALVISLVRVLCFHYACKLLDLTVVRAARPPHRISDDKTTDLADWRNRIEYIWLLFTEYRYFSFDIAAVQKGREQPASRLWTYAPPLVITLLLIAVPTFETKSLFGLLIVYLALELVHKIAHPRCKHPLFRQPFAARSISDFWRFHWHAGATPWLYSLGYRPAKQLFTPLFGSQIGRAAGVLGTFSLSGIWHASAASAATTHPWQTALSMWAIFVLQGVMCLLEQAIPTRLYGSIIHRVILWSISLWALGAWMRDAKEHSTIPEIAKYI